MVFNSKVKIAIVVTGLGMGGAEKQVCDLADQFVAKGCDVLLISLAGDTIIRPKATNITVVEVNMNKTPLGFIKAYVQASRLIKKFNPDVVHSHMVHANLFSRLLRLTTQIPKLICTAHSSNEGGRLRMLAYRMTDRLCDISTNVSQEAVDICVKRGAAPTNRMIAMHNGIDTERFTYDVKARSQLRSELGVVDGTPLVLAVGRLTVAKDYPNLLTAFQLLIAEGSLAELAIVGTGEELTKLTAMVADYGLIKRVHFLGLRHDVQQWMSAADLYVMSSAWEGMPLVLLEAMACERLVVATDCGGVKEVLGDCGFLVPPKNSQALADGLSAALSLTSDEVRVKGNSARQRVIERYSLQEQAKRWLELYQR